MSAKVYRNLFLTGPSGSGKTTLLLECLQPYRNQLTGFLSQRLLDEEGETLGFSLIPVETGGELCSQKLYHEEIPDIFLKRQTAEPDAYPRYQKIMSVFGGAGIRALSGSEDKTICLLDEIGGIELEQPEFRVKLYEVLNGSLPCIGVIKSQHNLDHMKKRISLRDHDKRSQLEQDIIHRFQGLVIPYQEEERDAVKEVIATFLNEKLREKRV